MPKINKPKDTTIQEQLAEKLQFLRKQKNVSQLEVANYIGLTVGAYQNYENGRREANYETLTKLAIFFGVTTDYLLGLEEKKNPIEAIASMFKLSNSSKALLAAYLYMEEKDRTNLLEAVQKLANPTDKKEE
ncbi:MAG: helix-turn-helix domain-containing protein [Oscillospiraceae bacterium]|nr:helix-turn-helix domain-containing protein [Oscillospiraceae bacterium]